MAEFFNVHVDDGTPKGKEVLHVRYGSPSEGPVDRVARDEDKLRWHSDWREFSDPKYAGVLKEAAERAAKAKAAPRRPRAAKKPKAAKKKAKADA